MQEVHRHDVVKHELGQAIDHDVEDNHDLRAQCRHAVSKQADDDNDDDGNVVEARENANDLPQSLGCELQERRDEEREERNDDTRDLGHPDHLGIARRLFFHRRVDVETKQCRSTVKQRIE